MVGFNLKLDLSKAMKKGQSVDNHTKINTYQPVESEVAERSSIGKNSEQAHPIDVSYKAHDEPSNIDDSSSSSGYDFVPPPELNPNVVYQNRPTPKVPGLGFGGPPKLGLGGLPGLSFKLNLTNVEGAKIITDEDKSRVQELKEQKPETFNKTVNLNLGNDTDGTPEKDQFRNTTKASNPPPKLPGFGGLGGFKLDLGKVEGANLITEEDKLKTKSKDLPYISKNNFTDTTVVKGEKPKKLNLKGKDSTTKITNETSMPDLKTGKSKKLKFNASRRLKKRQLNLSKGKDSRNQNPAKMNSLVIENSNSSSLFGSVTESEENCMPMYKRKIDECDSKAELEQRGRNLTPNIVKSNISSSQISKASEISHSDISNGSYVGSNRVFVPSLNIQEDVINKEIEIKKQHEEEIKHKREKDKKNPRFQMKRMSGDKKKMKNLFKAKNDQVFDVSF